MVLWKKDRNYAATEIRPDNKGEMMQFNKKGLNALGIIGTLVVVAVLVILVLFIENRSLFSQSDIVETQIGGIQGDADKDGIRNFFDKCPCTFGDSISEGCPAAFTDAQKEEDVKKYNSEPVCEIAVDETTTVSTTQQNPTGQKSGEQKPTEQKPEPAAFKNYRSIEIFGNTDDESDPALNGNIRLACTGWVGKDCHSEDNDCDDDEFSYDPTIKDGCWIMASEEDPGQNDCGQLKVDNGVIISLKEFSDLSADPNQYLSIGEEMDPKNLFRWDWKSTPEYGSLICNKGFWYGCKEANEGRELSELINGQKYKCISSEWIK